MRVMTSVQKTIIDHVKAYLSHRNVSFKEALHDLRGPYTKEHPEVYTKIETLEFEIFVYEDGQCQILKDGKAIINLEVESFSSIQEVEAAFFNKLTELFGKYPAR